MHHSPPDDRRDRGSTPDVDRATASSGRYPGVEARLEAIFAPMSRALPALAASSGTALPTLPTAPRQPTRAWVGGAAAMGLATLAFGLAFGLVEARTTSLPPPAPVVGTAIGTPAMATPRATTIVAPRAAVANVAVAPLPVAVRAPAMPTGDRPASVGKRADRGIVAPSPVRDAATQRAIGCQLPDDTARYECLKDNLQLADRDLVDAYADATDADVPLRVMINVNRRWDDARRSVRDDPDGALIRYRRLTAELRSVSAREDRPRGG